MDFIFLKVKFQDFVHVIQNTKEHLLNHILSQGNIKTRSYFKCNVNHDDDDEDVKINSNSNLNKQSDDFNKFRVGFINTQGGIFKKIDDLCDYMTVNQLHLLGISETNLKSNQTINKHNFIWIDKPTKETVGGLGILHNKSLIIKENKDSLSGSEGWIAVDVKIGKVWTTFIFIYLWQNGKTSFNAKNANNKIYQELSLFINKCKSINQNIVIMGDVNGRLKGSIGDSVENQQGKTWAKWTDSNNIHIFNGSSISIGKWTRMSNNSKSILDYGGILFPYHSLIPKKFIVDETSFPYSDHCPIILELDLLDNLQLKNDGKTNIGKLNYNNLTKDQKDTLRSNILPELGKLSTRNLGNGPNKVDQYYNLIIDTIKHGKQKMIETFFPKKKPNFNKKLKQSIEFKNAKKEAQKRKCDWVNSIKENPPSKKINLSLNPKDQNVKTDNNENSNNFNKINNSNVNSSITKSNSDSNSEFNDASNHQNNNVLKAYANYSIAKGKLLKIKHREFLKAKIKLRNHIFEVKSKTMKRFWQYRKRKSVKNNSICLRDSCGNLHHDISGIKKCLTEHVESLNKSKTSLQNKTSIEKYESNDYHIPLENILRGDQMARHIEPHEINYYIVTSSSDTAGGLDNIPNDIIKILNSDTLINVLTKFYNTIIDNEYIPDWWRLGDTPYLRKGKNDDYELLDNYRGITLQCCLGKFFFKIILGRMLTNCENRGIFCPLQFAFRHSRSTLDALYIMSQIINESKNEKGEDFFLAFLDLKKAFDSVDREKLWLSLNNTGFAGTLIRIIKSLYRNTREQFRLGEAITDFVHRNRGVPQGCVMAPFLFLIFINKIYENLSKVNLGIELGPITIPLLMFADDIVLCARNSSELSDMLKIIKNTLLDLDLTLNYKKSQIMKLYQPNINADYLTWTLNSHDKYGLPEINILKETNDYKYLGITFNNHNGNLSRIFSKEEKIKLEKMNKIYYTILDDFKNTFDKVYEGLRLWNNVCLPTVLYGTEIIPLSESTINILEDFQSNFMKKIFGNTYRLRHSIGKWELGLLPISALIDIKILTYWSKLKYNPWLPSSQIYQNFNDTGWGNLANKTKLKYNIPDDICDKVPPPTFKRLLQQAVQISVMRNWKVEFQTRINSKSKINFSWSQIYQYRTSFRISEHINGLGADFLLSKARIGQWNCPLLLYNINKLNSSKCINCAEESADLRHDVIHCPKFDYEREFMLYHLADCWGKNRFENWTHKNNDEKLAEILGLTGKFKEKHAIAIKFFLTIINKNNSPKLQEILTQNVILLF